MSEISVSERRLSAALDRIDQILEAGIGRRPSAAADPSRETADLQARLDATLDQLAALVRANDALVAANRALMDAAPDDGQDARHQSLEAEIAALHAARAAEIGQLGEIMAELEQFMGAARSDPSADIGEEAMADGGGLPEEDDATKGGQQ